MFKLTVPVTTQYNFVNAGENLAVHFSDTKKLVDAWVASPTHRANIMNGAYTETGIGIAEGEFEGFNTLFVVQFFGTPAKAPTSPPAPVALAVAKAQASVVEDVVNEDTPPSTPEVVSSPEDTQSQVLSESVGITESVEIVPADPAPVKKDVTESATDDSRLEKASDDTVNESNSTIAGAVNDIPNQYRKSMYSDFLATTTGGIPATIDKDTNTASYNTPFTTRLLTQPSLLLQIIYVVIGLFVLFSLFLSVFIEVRKQNPIQIAYSIGLLVLMFGLFYVQGILSSGVTIL